MRGRRPYTFTITRCLETPLKHDARVFDLASKNFRTSAVIRVYCFSALISHEIMYLRNNLVVVRRKSCGSEDGGVFCSEYRKPFLFFKNWVRKIKIDLREYP